MEPVDRLLKGLIYFGVLCVGVLVLHVVAATVQSRRISPRAVTFTKYDLIVNHKGETVSRGWDWIIAAENTSTVITLFVQKMPQLELHLPKTRLDESEYRILHGWLILHGKIALKVNKVGQAPRA